MDVSSSVRFRGWFSDSRFLVSEPICHGTGSPATSMLALSSGPGPFLPIRVNRVYVPAAFGAQTKKPFRPAVAWHPSAFVPNFLDH